MTIQNAVGVRNCNIDVKTGKQLSHEEVYGRVIEFLGGLDEVAKFLPFDLDTLTKAFECDEHFNSIPLKVWDYAAGFETHVIFNSGQTQTCRNIGAGIVQLYRRHKITEYSCSDGVCILKETARRLIIRQKGGE